ncbi:efflux RND transporter periplasmic adaptor subunit [Phyllobacterium sp. 0TCS1.6C]|jgi:RND family efflux transporter MFP subunit|uniref:efflux RND transporter periplasmic adaptor subunit n=1 Tax=unclassified Phyllobacterium TaxID=2638441 RepID=UPI0022654844|nr:MULTISPECIES: efflux RND transporter periplasmic adaptor subunit [unclassified Phyllobacterium]MCX8278746.1 efflux RND transporter periplasmic adaptor subunit [Phyllobacterium sp. 0TCS1.6C]MCX8293424.1 efflux RND transporter periplasmic adaptor subunit [Phyllobacterium sp. 0TCS1.6A]
MKVMKQLFLAVLVLALAGAGWLYFAPGGSEVLKKAGLDTAPTAATAPTGNNGGERSAALVVVRAAAEAKINDRLSAIGTGKAKSSVSVTPYAAGRLMELLVTSGTKVNANDIIAKLDSEAEIITADKARTTLKDAETKLARAKNLRTTNTVSAVQVSDAELAVENARLDLREAELALDRRDIRAPINGIVGILPVNAGNYITTSTQVATIDDRSEVLVDFWVPEKFAPSIMVGAPVSATSVARPGETFTGEVSAIDNRVDPASRTLHVQARITNPRDTLREGMAFQISMTFPGNTYPTVDPLAIQWGTDGAFVWKIVDNKAERVPVRIVQRNTTNVLVDANIKPGDEIVAEGVQSVRPGGAVQIMGRPQQNTDAGPLASVGESG